MLTSIETIKKEYDDILWDGLSSIKSYLVLHRLKRPGIHVAFMPQIMRVSDQIVWIGGKLRVGFDSRYLKDAPSTKIKPMNEQTAHKMLLDAYRKVKWFTESHYRVSTTIGIPVAGGLYNGEVFLDKFDADEFVVRLLAHIEKSLDFKIQGKRRVKKAVVSIFEYGLPSLFKDTPQNTPKLADGVVGQAPAAVFNKAVKGSNDKIVSFQQKVAEKQAKAEAKAKTNT